MTGFATPPWPSPEIPSMVPTGAGGPGEQLMSSDTRALVADDVRLDAIESVIVDTIRDGGADRSVAVAVIDAASPLADFGRAIEAARFPEFDMAKAMRPFEDASIFLFTVDVEKGRIGHVERLVRGRTAEEFAVTGRTGLEVLDDRLDAIDPAEQASPEQLLAEHGISSPDAVWNIATSCATARIAPTRQRPYSLLTVKGLLTLAEPVGVGHCLAYVNQKTVRSMARLGIPSTLVGQREFHLPIGEGQYAEDFVAIHMQSDQATLDAFWKVNPEFPLSRFVAELDLPVVVFVDDDSRMIDLTEDELTPNVELAYPDDRVVIDLTDDDGPVIDLTDQSAPALDLTRESRLGA
jgi:hypothetical protein